MEFWIYTTLIVLVLSIATSFVQTMPSQLESKSSTKLVWKVRPQAVQVAKEHDNVKLNCEFEYEYANGSRGRSSEAEKYFVIWYKDGASQNVLSLNDQLANVNSTSYEISGTYNLIIKNLTRAHSGVYTCQLFQSIDLVASVNLTVLVAPKYAKITLNPEVEVRKEYLVENEVAYLECCTNADANPTPIFEWHRVARANLSAETDRVSPYVNPTHVHHHSSSLIKSNQELVRRTTNGREELCNRLRSNLTRFDNLYSYRCLISNEALVNRKPIEDSLMLTVEYKPEVLVHLASNPSITKSIRLITNSSLELYCNASARPNVINYQWYFEDSLLKEHRTNTLSLNNLSRGNSGRYECRCSNRHGTASSEFRVDILYAEIKAVNRTAYIDQKNVLKEQRAVFVSSYENSSLTLTCQVESNPTNDNVMWYYYELSADGHMRNQVVLSSSSTASTWTSSHRSGDDSHSDTAASFYSHLLLSNLTSNHSGYYSCAISSFLVDSLNRTQALHVNSTYFLLVQYAPIVRGVKRVVYANNYDQVELSCEVKSNPQSIFSWYFGPKELFSSYKYNLSSVIYKQMHRTFLDDMENYHHYRSKLVINSLTQFDFGEYFCRANNIIGESVQIIKLKRKQKPETPIDLKAMEVTANSVQLSWLSGPNGAGGENTTYVITINNLVNVTSVVDHFARSDDSEEEDNDDDEDIESRFNMIEIRGLHANQEYELKIMASNSLGSSEFSSPIRVLTQKSPLRVERLPTLSNAQFNEQRESICFDLEKPFSSSQIDFKSEHSTTAAINDLLVRVEIDLDEALLANKTSESEEFRKIGGSNRKTTYLVNLNRMKYGQNCVPYTQLIDADSQQRNESSSSLALASSSQHKRRHQSSPFNVVTLDSTAMMNSADALRLDNNNAPIAREAKFSNVDTFGYDFHDFIRLHRVNVSLCYANDSSICSQKIGVSDYNPDLSAYLTLVAIGCSAVLIIFILLIASICCCCCRRDTNVSGGKRKQKGVGLKNDLNSKLVIKSFPIVTSQKDYDYSDESTKSSQQHILNTSQTGSGNGNHSSGSSSFNEKTYYHHAPHQGGMTQDVTLFAYTSSQSSAAAAAHHHLHHHHHISSIATVESDASSSTSLENKTTSTSQGGNTSSQAHSPYTLTEPTTSNVASTFISSFQQQQHQQHKLQPNNIYIKTYRQQQQGYNQQQFDHIDSSSYSTTPVNSTTNKKLVYEVIV